MEKIIYVGLGGFLGASLRYIISNNVLRFCGDGFPYGTLIANLLGGLLIGIIMTVALTSSLISPNTKLFLTTGLLGGLTTFSTFSYETITLFLDKSYIIAAINVCSNIFLSLLGVCFGRFLVLLFV